MKYPFWIGTNIRKWILSCNTRIY